ncbi:preprotein translocase subunit SecE [Actinoalloteichus hymeniacidonis]|uniref:Protein translocase subunit SecE n=1 Tax=Actinoalloteichus hymeniacidonis TaxID=340345 RepID=A0AAC9MWR2_9PSEU|nr:preprotein translocase subunit SecE [Actinoalloteichus hymeniacidonis]AOS61409.1 preprotein translocase, SecE subunit [Actinoalloteichus hymeniacidonis]MBB5910586.1 preprotein translocase subunit SecE [Actinoalloteichus hymeniacidonis]
MSEDREHKRDGERDDASRPRSAAERRASARPAARKDRGGGDAGSAKGEVVSSAGTTPKKGRPTDSRDTKGKRPSLPRRLGRFIREVVAELRKVIWPTRKQMVTYTLVVLVFVSFMVTLVAGLDIAFSQGVLWLFG